MAWFQYTDYFELRRYHASKQNNVNSISKSNTNPSRDKFKASLASTIFVANAFTSVETKL